MSQFRELAVVQVIDTGIGIPKADLPYIFDRFCRVDAARSLDSGRFGLGLAIAQQIVQAHRGYLHVTSVVGQGATFQVDLPLKPYQQETFGVLIVLHLNLSGLIFEGDD